MNYLTALALQTYAYIYRSVSPEECATGLTPHLKELRLGDGAVGLLTPGHHLLWEKVLGGEKKKQRGRG